ncbi:MAG TPA: type IV secretory system conjugative DNA transfer family protein [Thermoanaerobaculia bacterium]|nr:type IV secretory system conjugative DNA transfer family protein [Thermoanaerobaculia bacterium]
MDRPAADPLYRLPNYSHPAVQGIWLLAFTALVLDVAASLLLAGALLSARWRRLPPLGRPWVRFPDYPEPRWLAAALAGTLLLAALAGLAAWQAVAGRRTRAASPHPRSPGLAATALAAAAPIVLPVLLAAWLAALGPLYPLAAFLRWSARYQAVAALAGDLAWARSWLFAALSALLAVTLASTVLRLTELRESGDTHGSSHWASPAEVAATGLLHPSFRTGRSAAAPAAAGAVVVGAWLGRAPGRPRRRLHRLYDRRDRHVLAFAPSGSGKSTTLVIPTLLAWPSSVVVLDVKGELWHLTAGYRQGELGHTCLRLDLACSDGTAARYNPLLVVPRGPEDVKYAHSVADNLVDPDGRDQPRSFWDQSAHALLTATILHVLYAEPDKSLGGCARLLAEPGRTLRQTLELLLKTKHDPKLERCWRNPQTEMLTATHPLVAATARSLLDLDERTTSGIVATAQAHLSLFRDPVLAANTAASDFSPADLVAGEKPVSLYLTLSPADLNRLRGPVRILLNQLCRALTERLDFEPASSRPVHRHTLLLLLDEFAVLGKLDFFGRAMAYLRGYGIRVYLSIQSLSQLYDLYGQHQSITANCPVQVAFAPADVETAELLSKMTGPMTVHLAKRALANAPASVGPRRHTLSLQELARPLLTPEEVRRLPDDEALVFTAGHPPIRGRRVPYYTDAELVRRCALKPPRDSDRIEQPGGRWTHSAIAQTASEAPAPTDATAGHSAIDDLIEDIPSDSTS